MSRPMVLRAFAVERDDADEAGEVRAPVRRPPVPGNLTFAEGAERGAAQLAGVETLVSWAGGGRSAN